MPCDNSSGVGKRSENVVVTLKLRFKFFEFLDGGFHKRIIQISRCCRFIGGFVRWGEIRRRPFDSRAATVGRVAHKAIGFALLRSVFCHLVLRLDFFSGTPGPPPFSVMNSTPADSRAVQMASIFQPIDRWQRDFQHLCRVLLFPAQQGPRSLYLLACDHAVVAGSTCNVRCLPRKAQAAAAAGVMLIARALLGLSLSRPASGVAIITGSGERDGWLMAVGIHLGERAGRGASRSYTK